MGRRTRRAGKRRQTPGGQTGRGVGARAQTQMQTQRRVGSGRVGGGARERDDFLRSGSSKMRGRRRGRGRRGRGRSCRGIRKTRVKKSSLEIRELLNWHRTGSPVRKGAWRHRVPLFEAQVSYFRRVHPCGGAGKPANATFVSHPVTVDIYAIKEDIQSSAVQHVRRTIL